MPLQTVYIAGVGMTPFYRPSVRIGYEQLAPQAVQLALTNAGIEYTDVQQIYAGWAYGDTTSGQRALANLGATGVPFFNVNNACSSGSSALFLAKQAVQNGAVDCALVVGFEQMPAGALELFFSDRSSVLELHAAIADKTIDPSSGPLTPRIFAAAGVEHMRRDGISAEAYAMIAVKARTHAARNPKAAYQNPVSIAEVLDSRSIVSPLTKLQCCPPTSGAAAAIICSASYAKRNGLSTEVELKGMGLTSDIDSTFSGSAISMVGYDISARAASQAYKESGIGPSEIDVVELHDCFTINEALSYESLGLTSRGTAEKFIVDGNNTYGGSVVVNPSGGLLSKGHPLGATGLAQITELTLQLRGQAQARQVPNARTALQHNVGLNGAAVVSVLVKN